MMTSTRERLPQRRGSVTADFIHRAPSGAPQSVVATLGYYADGRLGEVFLRSGKIGTDVDVSIKDAAIVLSFALQHGATVEAIRSAMTRDAKGRPEGVMGTLLDLISDPDEPLAQDARTHAREAEPPDEQEHHAA